MTGDRKNLSSSGAVAKAFLQAVGPSLQEVKSVTLPHIRTRHSLYLRPYFMLLGDNIYCSLIPEADLCVQHLISHVGAVN